MTLWVFGLDLIGYYLLSSIIILKVQCHGVPLAGAFEDMIDNHHPNQTGIHVEIT